MKRIYYTLLATALLCSCSTNDDDPWNEIEIPGNNGNNGSAVTPGSSESSTAEGLMDLGYLNTFTVDFNTEALSETEVIPSDEEDTYYNEYVENNFSEKTVTKIQFNGTSDATISNAANGDEYTVTNGHVVVNATNKGLTLEVSGSTTDGSLKIYSDKKFQLKLNGVSITNPDGAAINIQNGNCFVQIENTNTLSDGENANYNGGEEDMKAVFFSEDDLRFNGTGKLTINAVNKIGKAGISCDDAIFIRPNTNIQVNAGSSAGNGIKANDAIVIKGGVLNIKTEGKGSKALSSDGYVEIAGGRTTGITTGGVDTSDSSDPSGCAGIKADSVLNVIDGELWLMSTGQGGKGMSADDDINISGGKLYILTTGTHYGSNSSNGGGKGWNGSSSSDNSVSPKGIRSDKNINISGGEIYVRCTGGGSSGETNAEGIESKATLTISGGYTAVNAYDDGLNASTAINITGGYVFSISTGNCDGIDSNGSFSSTGGVMICIASTQQSEDGLDAERNITFNGGTVIALSSGQGMGTMGNGSMSGHYIQASVSGNKESYVALTKDSKPVVVFQLPRTYQNGKLILANSNLGSGTFKLETGVTPTGGSLWMNYYQGATSVSGGSSSSVTVK